MARTADGRGVTALLPPSRLGLPARYNEWRDGQDDQFTRLLAAGTRFKVNAAPVGSGKSLVNMGLITALGARGLYLTSTRGLQDQLRSDFAPIGLFDVRGMSNYSCLDLPPRHGNNCDRGPCLDGMHCELKYRGCLYYDAVREARTRALVSTNYAMYLTQGQQETGGLGRRDVLILDEAHEAAEILAEHMRVTLDPDLVASSTWPVWHPFDAIEPWQEWAQRELPSVSRDHAEAEEGSEEKRKLRRLKDHLTRLVSIKPGERWVWQWEGDKVILEPVWAAPYAEDALFRGVENIVLSSATIRRASLKYLGLRPTDYTFVSALSPFPAWRRPIIQLHTGAKLSWGSDEYTKRIWLGAIDSIIEGRLDRKGIIHAVSFDRARMIANSSRFFQHMLLPTRGNTRDVVARFKSMRPPAILVSPSVHTGYDFPYDQARYQIIAKMPFAPVKNNPILQLRQDEDPDYLNLLTIATLEQMAGRVVRAADDLGETFITDDHGEWFHRRNQEHFSGWYYEAYRRLKQVPPAPPLTA
jgi:Rad3-related DNA helicase